MAPLTDTVMASVPVDDAGVGSATNDVSRELGAALGVAVLGSVVTSLYASDVREALAGTVTAEQAEAASEGVGAAVVVANELPSQVADQVIAIANASFVDAMTVGFYVGAGFAVAALIAALTLVPNRMREFQAVAGEPMPTGLAEPVGSPLVQALLSGCAGMQGRVVGQGRCPEERKESFARAREAAAELAGVGEERSP